VKPVEPGSGRTQRARGLQSPRFWSGPSFAEGIMASGPCAAPTGRRHGRTDQPSQSYEINLAKGEPSRHGAKRLQDLVCRPLELSTASARLVSLYPMRAAATSPAEGV
jgi:hypothetical protein